MRIPSVLTMAAVLTVAAFGQAGGPAGPPVAEAAGPPSHPLIGSIDGRNAAFLVRGAFQAANLRIFRNGIPLRPAVDYSSEAVNGGAKITFLPMAIPQPGDFVEAYEITPSPVWNESQRSAQPRSHSNLQALALEQARDQQLASLRPQAPAPASAGRGAAPAPAYSKAVETLERRLAGGTCGVLREERTCQPAAVTKSAPRKQRVLGGAGEEIGAEVGEDRGAPTADASLESLRRLQSRVGTDQGSELRLSGAETWLLRSGAAVQRLRRFVPKFGSGDHE